MPYFIVTLIIQIGAYEKATTKLIQAADADAAEQRAIEMEAHEDLEWADGGAYDLDGNFHYKARRAFKAAPGDVDTLKKYLR